MKILHVLDHSAPLHSGYTFRTLSILNQQRALGWETEHLTSAKHSLAANRDDAQTVSDLPLVEEVDGFKFHRTPESNAFWLSKAPAGIVEPLAIIRGLEKRLYDLVEELKPDVLHAHSPALNGVAAIRVSKRTGIPVVYECRAFWEDAAVNHGSTQHGSLRYRLTRSMESYVFRRANAITTICEGLRQDIIARGVKSDKVTVIPNAVDIDLFHNLASSAVQQDLPVAVASHWEPESSIILGFFGSFYDYEGLAFLLDAMPKVLEQNPNIRLLLVGGGPQEALIRNKIAQLQLGPYVLMTGRVPHQQIQDYYRLADVMLYPRLPMRLTDLVTPLKPLEAMAIGKLVVASDVGGHKELIQDGQTGYLFKAGCQVSLADKLSQVIAERDNWPELLLRGREFVVNDRNWARSVSYYKDVYAPLCNFLSLGREGVV